jgi:hypothetical protein
MPQSYRQILEKLHRVFPQPVSDPVHGAYMVFSIQKTLDQVDALKSDAPILGSPVTLDWEPAGQSRTETDRWRAVQLFSRRNA